jgi:hypothetical protein
MCLSTDHQTSRPRRKISEHALHICIAQPPHAKVRNPCLISWIRSWQLLTVCPECPHGYLYGHGLFSAHAARTQPRLRRFEQPQAMHQLQQPRPPHQLRQFTRQHVQYRPSCGTPQHNRPPISRPRSERHSCTGSISHFLDPRR